jgi:hypothetical protein
MVGNAAPNFKACDFEFVSRAIRETKTCGIIFKRYRSHRIEFPNWGIQVSKSEGAKMSSHVRRRLVRPRSLSGRCWQRSDGACQGVADCRRVILHAILRGFDGAFRVFASGYTFIFCFGIGYYVAAIFPKRHKLQIGLILLVTTVPVRNRRPTGL